MVMVVLLKNDLTTYAQWKSKDGLVTYTQAVPSFPPAVTGTVTTAIELDTAPGVTPAVHFSCCCLGSGFQGDAPTQLAPPPASEDGALWTLLKPALQALSPTAATPPGPLTPPPGSAGLRKFWRVRESADADGDSLLDKDEVEIYHTNPFASDTDGDTISDADEVARGWSPLRQDTDLDGWTDAYESLHGTDPAAFDMPEITLQTGTRVDAITMVPSGAAASVKGALTIPGKLTVNNRTVLHWNYLDSRAGGAGSVFGFQMINDYLVAPMDDPDRPSEVPANMWFREPSKWVFPDTSHAIIPALPGEAMTAGYHEWRYGDGSTSAGLQAMQGNVWQRLRTVALHSSRALPFPWTVKFKMTPFSRTRTTRGTAYTFPADTRQRNDWQTGTTAYQTLTIPAKSEDSNEIQLGGGPLGTAMVPAVFNPTAQNNGSFCEWEIIQNLTATASNPADRQKGVPGSPNYDGDADGLPDLVELSLGTDPLLYDSNSNGLSDAEDLGSPLYSAAQWRTANLRIGYDYHHTPTATAPGPSAPPTKDGQLKLTLSPVVNGNGEVDHEITTPGYGLEAELQSQIAELKPFENTAPAEAAANPFEDAEHGAASSQPVALMVYYKDTSGVKKDAGMHACGYQRKTWPLAPAARATQWSRPMLRLKTSSGPGITQTTTVAVETVTYAPNQVLPTAGIELRAALTIPGGFDTAAAGSEWKVEERLVGVDLDVVHPATGALGEVNEDAGDGGYVSVQRLEGSLDVAPRTKLVIHQASGADASVKTRLIFDGADRFRIYQNQARTQQVTSGVTEFSSTSDTTLYLQGFKKSLTRGGETVTVQAGTGGQWANADSVKFTIVQSEFLFQVKAFIPYAWTETEAEALPAILPIPVFPYSVPNTLKDKVAKGDLHPGLGMRIGPLGFENAYSTGAVSGPSYQLFENAPFRVCQTVIVTPYAELHRTPDIARARRMMTAPISEHYTKSTGVDPTELSLHMGFKSLIPAGLSKAGPPLPNVAKYELLARTGHLAELTIDGGGKDGAMPAFTTWATTDIHWRLHLRVLADSDPLQPTVQFSGTHDTYPAYGIIVLESDGTYTDILRDSPAVGARPGPISLLDANELTVGSSKVLTK